MKPRIRDTRLMRGESSRERRIPEELMISKLMTNGPPLAMYDMGVGCYYEFRTLKIVYPDMVVFGCEPCPAEYNELLPIFTGKLLPVAIGAENGRKTLYLSALGQGGSSLHNPSTVVETVEVDVWTLDKFDEWAGSPDKILLWMDIEGSELDALKGGDELLSSGRVEWINVETRDAHATCLEGHPTTREVSDFLRQYGYRIVHRYNVQGDYPEAAGDTIYFKNGVRAQ